MEGREGFRSFFRKATGNEPFPWQENIALSNGFPELVRVPTGLGKTAGAALAWLWKRRNSPEETPRRLVYCLPMRTLVEQTADEVRTWMEKLQEPVPLHVLLGGAVDRNWDDHPEKEMVLVGTQDMLLSRALNRGYAESRFRWPVQFGLLHTDCFWVLDEVQLMGAGLPTSVQLQAFREKLGVFKTSCSMWMSATLLPEWLQTVDRPFMDVDCLEPGMDDLDHPVIRKRIHAPKSLSKAVFVASSDGVAEAERLAALSDSGGFVLGVFNTVTRAQKVFGVLKNMKLSPNSVLLHSRFRRLDRDRILKSMLKTQPLGSGIVVATQVVEAGMDISAKAMLTDAAPWASMVQRFGRVNRRGEFPEANIEWIKPDRSVKGFSAPYDAEELEEGVAVLESLESASIRDIPPVSGTMSVQHVLRKRDLEELFDTTPDLEGKDLDVSRFIRSSDDRGLFVFWRDLSEESLQGQSPAARDELCPVPMSDLQALLRREGFSALFWDHQEGKWERARRAYPGQILMLDAKAGSYTEDTGWSPGTKGMVPVLTPATAPLESFSEDYLTETGCMTIAEHTDSVISEFRRIVSELGLQPDDAWIAALRWHDAGKAHPAFQERFQAEGAEVTTNIGKGPWLLPRESWSRKVFRHELASGLAALQNGEADLTAYLATAHHGKVRLSIRAMPDEPPPRIAEDGVVPRFARGVHEGDELPSVDLGGGVQMLRTRLSLAPMEIGGGGEGKSWLARMLQVMKDMGPFRLAYLESLTRASDWRASRKGDSDA